jgi:hypothetical protein
MVTRRNEDLSMISSTYSGVARHGRYQEGVEFPANISHLLPQSSERWWEVLGESLLKQVCCVLIASGKLDPTVSAKMLPLSFASGPPLPVHPLSHLSLPVHPLSHLPLLHFRSHPLLLHSCSHLPLLLDRHLPLLLDRHLPPPPLSPTLAAPTAQILWYCFH